MSQRPVRAIAMILVVLTAAACASGAPSASIAPSASTPSLVATPSATPPPSDSSAPSASSAAQAVSFAEYAVAFCSAFDGLIEAVGNPDTDSGSVLSKSLDGAVEAGDAATADRQAAAMTTKLEAARQAAAIAGRWPTAAPMTAQLDRVLVAFETMITAKQAVARHVPGAPDPQIAFEQAGGAIAWFAMLDAYRGVARPSGATTKPCGSGVITP
jgi:hypothetical protein